MFYPSVLLLRFLVFLFATFVFRVALLGFLSQLSFLRCVFIVFSFAHCLIHTAPTICISIPQLLFVAFSIFRVSQSLVAFFIRVFPYISPYLLPSDANVLAEKKKEEKKRGKKS